MESQQKFKLKGKLKMDLRVELLKAIIQRKDVIVFDDGDSFEEFEFRGQEQRSKKRKCGETNGSGEMMETD